MTTAREKALIAALPDPAKLRRLADWIDIRFPNDTNPEVQQDLRRWADLAEEILEILPMQEATA